MRSFCRDTPDGPTSGLPQASKIGPFCLHRLFCISDELSMRTGRAKNSSGLQSVLVRGARLVDIGPQPHDVARAHRPACSFRTVETATGLKLAIPFGMCGTWAAGAGPYNQVHDVRYNADRRPRWSIPALLDYPVSFRCTSASRSAARRSDCLASGSSSSTAADQARLTCRSAAAKGSMIRANPAMPKRPRSS